ncbi:hypothetical protein LTR94_038054, partial [Friedmanniomyces endolithicus]
SHRSRAAARPRHQGAILARADGAGPDPVRLLRPSPRNPAGDRAQYLGQADRLLGLQGIPRRRCVDEAQLRAQADRGRP